MFQLLGAEKEHYDAFIHTYTVTCVLLLTRDSFLGCAILCYLCVLSLGCSC